jgi:hypothetical protein
MIKKLYSVLSNLINQLSQSFDGDCPVYPQHLQLLVKLLSSVRYDGHQGKTDVVVRLTPGRHAKPSGNHLIKKLKRFFAEKNQVMTIPVQL